MTRTRALGPGRLWKRDRSWVLDFTSADGRRRRKVLGGDKRVAERRRQELIARRDMELDGLGAREGQNLPLAEVKRAYLEDLGPRVTPKHLRNVQAKLETVVAELDGTLIRDLRPAHLTSIRARLVAEGRSHRTANLHADVVAAMLRWAVDAGVIAQNPLASLKRLPEGGEHRRYKRRAMTEPEIVRFLAQSEADDEECDIRSAYEGLVRIPQTPLWVAFLETAARWNELRTLTWRDVDLKGRTLVLRAENTKSRKARAIPMTHGLVRRLGKLRAHHGEAFGRIPGANNHVFLSPDGCPWAAPTTNPMRIFNRLLDRAGIDKIDASGEKLDLHALRHTAATRLAKAGVSLIHTQKLLGHSDPKLTAQIYAHLDVEDLREAIERVPAIETGAAKEKTA